MDTIFIEDLEVFSNHGVLKEENILGQKFIISASLKLNTRNAGQQDNLELSVNYAEVCHYIKEIMENHTFKLIETAAETLCASILLRFEKINEITLEIKKPWAPIHLPLKYVSISITRKWHDIYLSLGSNLGDRKKYLDDAIEDMKSNKYLKDIKISEFIETEPVGGVEQDDFINCCLYAKTLFTPHELLNFTSSLEQKAKRERIIHWGPRTLDVDIILYDEDIINDDKLTIPHSEMQNREFVLVPLCQLSPYAYNPVLKKYSVQLLNELQNKL